jgi:putative restriction endonuclease
MPLSPGKLGTRLFDALVRANAAPALESEVHERPLLVRARYGTTTIGLRVFLWRVTHGGARRAAHEYRVQTTRPHNQPLLADTSRQTLLLGYHEALDVFAAWDVRVHPDPGGSSSLQVDLDLLEGAAEHGFVSRPRETRAGRELVVAFDPDSIGAYLEVVERLAATGVESATPAVEAATSGSPVPDSVLPVEAERRREIRHVAALVRDSRFRAAVVRAYAGRCAFCDLDLGLVQAAHIEGVAEGGKDVVGNGVAACPTHHIAFDRGLLVVEGNTRIVVNRALAGSLGLDPNELGRLRHGLRDRLHLPGARAARPDPALFERHRLRWTS